MFLKYKNINQTIPLVECKNRNLYRICSRNLAFGVFHKSSRGFIGIREKFGYKYLFTEYHIDIGEPHGTVNPKEDLGPIPEDIELTEGSFRKDYFEMNSKLFEWLQEKENEYF